MRILIVDDNEIARALLQHTLCEAGHEVTAADSGRKALRLLRTGQYRMVISDWEMPEIDGLELCRRIRSRRFAGYIYIILVTAHDGTRDVVEGLDAGADDFVAKPFDPKELCVRFRTGERILSLDSRDLTIFSLAKLAESRDPETGAHLERMREYCRILAEQLSCHLRYKNRVDGEYIQSIYLTSPLHDIGKVGVPDAVLNKTGPLTEQEFEIMKTHTTIGADTLGAAAQEHPGTTFLQMAHDIALTHHERFDGSGYPSGLAGGSIPLCGRIVAVADVYDALISKRVYKSAYCHEFARSTILAGTDVHFDPDVVACFASREEEFVAVHERFADTDDTQTRSINDEIATANA